MLDYRHEMGLFLQDNLTLTFLGAGSIIVEFTVLPPDDASEGEADSAVVAGSFVPSPQKINVRLSCGNRSVSCL